METLRIRTVRTKAGYSVRGLAGAAGISPGLLSQVERGLTEPSLDTLRRIAKALEVPLFSLFEEQENSVAVVRAPRRALVQSPHSGIRYTRISPGFGKLEVLEGTLEPGGCSSTRPWSHPSEECVLLVEGRIVVEVDGRRHELAEGDSASFDSRLPHRYLNETGEPARFVLSVTPPSY
ncbi:helix-turn-helix domain-containing protein [Sciscionella marina]|uniref:helix-turn-helix domain-containing protein n=1 Tax=Sciscionella marina TaxID=508770 RepID=UPI00036BF0D1|nr:XRE family transcriptional regulator [Sciscionella marina]